MLPISTHYRILIYLLMLVFFSKKDALAQQFLISGIVKDTSGIPLPYANILVRNASDSSLIRGAITEENGKFEIELATNDTLFLQITIIGYKNYLSSPFTQITADQLPEVFSLSTDAMLLDGATVEARKPFIERRPDMLVLNVSNTIVSSGTNALEILRRSPGVMVDAEGTISVRGKSGVIVLINGKQLYLAPKELAATLKTIPSDQVDKIEIITAPSAKYDAAGNAGVINIILKKDLNLGMNGTLNGSFIQGYYPKQNGGVNFNYRMKKLNFSGGINLYNGLYYFRTDWTRNYLINGENQLFNQHSYGIVKESAASGSFAIDFSPNKKHNFSLTINSFRGKGWDDTYNYSSFYFPITTLRNGSNAIGRYDDQFNSFNSGLNYEWKIDSTGKTLSVNTTFAQFEGKAEQLYTTHFYDSLKQDVGAPGILKSNTPSEIHVYAAKLDYTQPLGKKMMLESGMKFSQVKTDNDAKFYNQINGVDEVDTGRTNHFIYDEQISAAYLNFRYKSDKWFLQAGLRAEHTLSVGEQLAIDSVFRRNYTNLFPGAILGWDINENHQINLSYNKRIQRPNYHDMNPFLYFEDPYTSYQGNPYLLPEKAHNLEFTYSFYNSFSISASFTRIKDNITSVTKQIDSLSMVYQTDINLEQFDQWRVYFTHSGELFSWWTSTNVITLYKNHYEGDFLEGTLDQQCLTYLLQSDQQFYLGKKLSAQVSYRYISRQLYGIYFYRPLSALDLGVKWTFAKERATLNLAATDVFWTLRPHMSVNYENMNMTSNGWQDSRTIMLSFTWKFGKSVTEYEEKSNGAEDLLERVN